jgi:polysaccharide deacetylase 2 family uncharacterized protein YibQ
VLGLLAGTGATWWFLHEPTASSPSAVPQRLAQTPAPSPGRHAAPLERRAARTETPPSVPAQKPPPPAVAVSPGDVRLALVIDDLGRSLTDLATLGALDVPLTYAVLPYESQTPAVVAALHQRGDEVICHLPMEPRTGDNPGPGALRLGMSKDELRAATVHALEAVPGAVGVNNHMGSSLSADASAMTAILGVLAGRHLFFLDSRTSAQSVGFRVAGELGLPAAERQVFLDDDLAAAAVRVQFARLLEVGRERGEAIAIGHPHPATLAVLAEQVPKARALGYRFVLVSDLLTRPEALTR